MKIVVLSDLHYSTEGHPLAERKGHLADILLLRTIHRINRYIKPDLTVVCGDLVDSPKDIDSLKKTQEILAKLTSPTIVIPGNHDPEPEVFYQIISKPAEYLDIKGFRFIPAFDEMRPGWNARRNPYEVQRCRQIAESFQGRSILIQHVPLFAPDTVACPFAIENASEILAGPFAGAISGHWHCGFDIVGENNFFSVCAPALCEAPFTYMIVEIDENTGLASVNREQLQLPPGYIDTHVHTRNAYCQENLTPDRMFEFAQAFGLKTFAFTEHSGHLYFPAYDYWSGTAQLQGFNKTPKKNRIADYFRLLDYYGKQHQFIRGFEIDVDTQGNLMVEPEDLQKVDLRVGAVHWLNGKAGSEEQFQDFLFRSEALLQKGCHILAHPFRIFKNLQDPVPEYLYTSLVQILKKYNAAAEINYHTNWPNQKFFRMCLENNVKIALGSDTHNLYEIGEFYAHLKLLDSIGAGQEHLFYPDFK